VSSVDNKIVSMQFDNAAFESKISATIKSLDALTKSLDMASTKKGLEDLSTATKGFNVGDMTSAIEGVSNKFLALSTIGITALANITTKAIATGAQLVKSLTLEPVMQGFQEYETNMNSIQTILANTDSKGTTLEQVNAALDQLNTYSDQTIYNFAEMARNIGTFTAAGVDLDTSVNSIKGIANLAAISGSNSMQASTAMYQLSQAIATGSVKLMDWNSVVNAGMGGEVFQKALFETGKSLGTIKDTPIDTTFEQWTDAGNSFRGSLESGWLTADVLTNTLQGFTGDLTAAQLMALGYTEAQAQEMLRLGALGKSAATEVKTLTQLLSTVKESVASGWSASFRLIFGDFEEAKELFTGINNAIGGFVSASADARNALLQGWKDMGGRTLLITALKNAFYALGQILTPIKEAFRSVFPKTTSEELFTLTQRIALLAQKLIPAQETIENLKSGFQGFFYAIKIGMEVLKGIARVIGDVIDAIIPEGAGGGLLEFFGEFGRTITNFYGTLLATQAIPEFFERVSTALTNVVTFIQESISAFKEFFTSIDIGELDSLGSAFDRIRDRFANIFSFDIDFGAMLGPFEGLFEAIKGVFEDIWTYIKDWFADLGDDMAAATEEGDYSKVLDTLNVALLGGIVGLLASIKKGLKIDFGDGLFGPGVVESINDTFGALNNHLQALTLNVKAEALLKLAAALALLTASVLVLSLIDSAALTKALAAMAVGFGQLIGSMLLLTKMDLGPMSAAKMALMSAGLILLAGAILVLSVAVKILSTMDTAELTRGLVAVTVLLAALSAAAIPLSANASGLVRAGLAMIPLAIALNLLAVAMKIFATMSWEEMAKGLVAVGGSLLLIAAAMQLMPANMPLTAAGLVLVGGALNLIAASMLLFATMDWEDIGKGIVGVAGGLLAIALAMNLMPVTLPITASGLVLVGVALGLIAGAMMLIADMSWEEIGRGLAGMAGALLVLAVATAAMTGSIVGAAALGIVTLALFGLVRVVKEFSGLSLKELGIGLLGMAATLAVLAAAALLLGPAIGPMLALGAALFVIGAGFALFGVGVSGIAKAFEILAKAGAAGAEAFVAALDVMLKWLPKIATALAQAILDFAATFLEGLPVIVTALGVLIEQILDTFITLIPKIGEVVSKYVAEFLRVIREASPDIIATGIKLVKDFLTAIRDNIEEIVTLGLEIITTFLQGIADNIDEVIAAGTNLIVEFIKGIGNAYVDIVAAGAQMIADIITGIGQAAEDIVAAGANAIISFLEGVASNVVKVVEAGFQIVIDMLNGLADSIERNRGALAAAGFNVLDAIFGGVLSRAIGVFEWFTNLPGAILGKIANFAETFAEKGRDLIRGIWTGIVERWAGVRDWFAGLDDLILEKIGDLGDLLYNVGKAIIQGLWDGMKWLWDHGPAGWIKGLGGWIEDHKGPLAYDKVMLFENGKAIMQGLYNGMQEGWQDGADWVDGLGDAIISSIDVDPNDLTRPLTQALNAVVDRLGDVEEFNPTITPVLDLSNIQRDAKTIGGLLGGSSIGAEVSLNQARVISSATEAQRVESDLATANTGPSEVKFEQNIFSPTALSTNDIYRQTRSQIALAKLELEIP
jgi:tape measure domain-containing protein